MSYLIRTTHDTLSSWPSLTPERLAISFFPDRPDTKVPLAVSLALITESARDTIILAANVGGDADSVASIGGAIAGALNPASTLHSWFDTVLAVNGDGLGNMPEALMKLRQ